AKMVTSQKSKKMVFQCSSRCQIISQTRHKFSDLSGFETLKKKIEKKSSQTALVSLSAKSHSEVCHKIELSPHLVHTGQNGLWSLCTHYTYTDFVCSLP